MLSLSPGLLHREQDCCPECCRHARGSKKKGTDVLFPFILFESFLIVSAQETELF